MWNKDLKKNCHYIIPIFITYLMVISYHPEWFYFFGSQYCQLVMLTVIIVCHKWSPTISWVLGILFVMTYKFYYQTEFIQEAFSQKFVLPKEKDEEMIDEDIKRKLSEDEMGLIEKINQSHKDDIAFLLEDDIERIKKYSCASHGIGVGLPEQVKDYDLTQTINFDV